MMSDVDVKINFFSTSDGRGDCGDMFFPAFLPPPKLGLLVPILVKNFLLCCWSNVCGLLSMETGKFYLTVLQCVLGCVQSC